MNLFIEKFRRFFYAKKILWTTHVRIFCDGGQPIVRYFPRFRNLCYASHWEMKGFAVYLFGREFNFSFGVDKHNLYDNH